MTAPLTNYASNTLTGGTYKVSGTSGAAGTLQVNTLGSSGGEIHTNAATIVLNGPNSDFVDASGNNALSDLTSNTVSFTIENGRNFTSGAGAFTNTGTVLIGANSAFSTASGDYQQSDASAVTQVDGVLAPSTATVRISGGTLAGTGTVQGSVISIGDTIHPGDVLASDPPGLLTVTGNLSLDSASTFAEDIMGSTPGAGFGVLDVGGAVTLGGTLDVSLSEIQPVQRRAVHHPRRYRRPERDPIQHLRRSDLRERLFHRGLPVERRCARLDQQRGAGAVDLGDDGARLRGPRLLRLPQPQGRRGGLTGSMRRRRFGRRRRG